MSHVSTTAHYNLPIYGGSDIINPLTDVNGTNEALDTAIYEVAQELASGVTDITDVKNKVGDASLDTASQNLSGAVNELKSAIDTQAGDITTAEADISTLQSQMATTTGNITTLNTTVAGLQTEVSGKASQTAVNTLATKVGTDALITTADNLSGAVNELKNASGIDYNNTTSGLTATNVQNAIDEVENQIKARDIADVTYTCDGTKNLAQAFTAFADLIDFSKIKHDTVVEMKIGTVINRSLIVTTADNYIEWQLGTVPSAGDVLSLEMGRAYKSSAGTQSVAILGQIKSNLTVNFLNQSTISTTAGDYFKIYY